MPDFAVNITNASKESDAQAARYLVDRENDRRAALDPPETPLPTTPAASLLSSWEIALAQGLAAAHPGHVAMAAREAADTASHKERWAISTDAQRAASTAQLEPLPTP